MSFEIPISAVFNIANAYVMPFWLLMIFAPGWKRTHQLISGLWYLVPLAIGYIVLLSPTIASTLPVLLKPELGIVAELLATERGASIGWIHFLIFDFFVGRWMYLEMRKHRTSPWVGSPMLAATLLTGPIGLVLWLLFNGTRRLIETRRNSVFGMARD